MEKGLVVILNVSVDSCFSCSLQAGFAGSWSQAELQGSWLQLDPEDYQFWKNTAMSQAGTLTLAMPQYVAAPQLCTPELGEQGRRPALCPIT